MWSKLVQRDADLLCRTQIWDVTNGRLVVSGVHNKMAPKMPSPSPKSSSGTTLYADAARAKL